MWGFGLLRSPRLLLLLPQLGLGIAASRSQAGTMNLGGGSSSARCSPSDEDRQCLHLSTVPGADPQRSNELLLLVAAAEGPERRGLSGDRTKEGPQPQPQHHVLYFPGDVQVTWGLPGHLFLLCVCELPTVSSELVPGFLPRQNTSTHALTEVAFRLLPEIQPAASTPLTPSSCSPGGTVSLQS